MSMGILDTALSGLAAFQRSLETTSNNISNVNTEGYSRQRVELSTRPEQYTGAGYVGTGVNIANITRSYDQFITGQMRSSTSAFKDVDAYHTMASQIDNMIADEKTGLSPAMKSFFNAVNDVANDPSSIPARQAMLSEADSMSQQFNTVAARFDELRKQVNNNLDTSVSDLNGFAKSVADLNTKIVADIGRASGTRMPNDLLDQRDLLLNKIAEKADISVVPQSDGSVSVFIGQGQPLVLGNNASTLSVQSSKTDPLHKEIVLNGQDISSLLSGGEIYGNLRFRDEVLDPAQRQLGTLAVGLATEFNKVHQAGVGLDGSNNKPFFDLGAPNVQVLGVAKDPNLVVSATFFAPTSAANLGTSYQLDVTATLPAVTYSLTDLSGSTPPVTGLTAATLSVATEAVGFDVSFPAGTLNVGDSFQISPAFGAAQKLKVAISNPQQIAAASAANLPGDNSNVLKLANLEKQTLMKNGKSTFSQVYGQLVADVGSKTHAALVSSSAQDVLLKQATSARENLAGVNLDEEAANLIKFQNSYQAAAQTVTVAKTLFDTLIGAVR
ncbi:MAG: flagellar hook-associated protein FlgK [Methylococcaceae bacterium]|nr:flagellar hook-associated protein FlgK [Methylococcaceae bacterium]